MKQKRDQIIGRLTRGLTVQVADDADDDDNDA